MRTDASADRDICRFLDSHGVAYRRFDHAPVFTCEAAMREVPAAASGIQTKNLFLRDRRGRRHWLLVTSCDKAVDLGALGPAIEANRLGLASAERLAAHLGVTPGSVTVLALVNDPGHAVELLVDAEVWRAGAWRCHPMVNSATLVIDQPDIERFLALTGHVPRVLDVPGRGAA